MSALTHFGIRHHGPGSARSLLAALERLSPDIILIEGPPEANDLIAWVKHEEMQAPVAILVYEPDDPQQAVFYPFADFSPEWQALHYSLKVNIPARFIDLAQSQRMALGTAEAMPEALKDTTDPIRQDPLGQLAIAAGYSDGERWWDIMVESRQDSSDLFAAISEAMVALREEVAYEDQLETLREASMRQGIRAAQSDGFTNIAVVCGAWHVPALLDVPPAKHDSALLKGLAKKKVAASWVPWSYGRLSYRSGYGAGISSPGWYQHVWETREHLSTRWLTKVAELFRQQDLAASSAHIIEGVRLAETLAALRGKAMPGLEELNEATQSVFCFGSDVPMKLIHEQLIISEKLGEIPTDTPMLPLQRDLQGLQRRLRFKPKASEEDFELDLRKPLHLERSHLLHRLALLGIPWGKRQQTRHGKKGSFHENWRTAWQPDFALRLIEMTIWGNTIVQAAYSFAVHQAETAQGLPELSQLLNSSLLADLGEAVTIISQQLEQHAARSSDMLHLLETLPPLVQVVRYGNVRQTDAIMVAQVIAAIMPRIGIGLPSACASLDDEAAAEMIKAIMAAHQALQTLQEAGYLQTWYQSLGKLSQQRGLHPLLAGRATRLLLDSQQLSSEASITSLRLALNLASEPLYAAHWLEGFLSGSGLILIHDETLWQVLDDWVRQLHSNDFDLLVPLLRRTFATFSSAERRQLGTRVGSANTVRQESPAEVDEAQAERVMPLIRVLLGLEGEA